MHGWRDLALLCYGVIYLKNKVYLFTSGYFTLQRSQSQHTAYNTDELWPCLWYEKWSAMIGHFHWGNDDFKKKTKWVNVAGTIPDKLESNSGIICWSSRSVADVLAAWWSWVWHMSGVPLSERADEEFTQAQCEKRSAAKKKQKQTNKQKSPVEPARATAWRRF